MDSRAQASPSLERRTPPRQPVRASRLPAPPAPTVAGPQGGPGPRTVLGLLLGLALVGLFVLLPLGPTAGQAQNTPPASGPAAPYKPQLFRGWGKPDVALVLSGEQRGYLQPCGCSHPQLGGMARRYNFLDSLKQRWPGVPLVAVDLGDLAAPSNGPQKMLKYATAMKALDLLGYTAIGIGQNEMAMPLIEALGNYSLNNPSPRVLAANLAERGPGQLFHGMVEGWVVAGKGGAPRVGVTGLIDSSVAAKAKDPAIKLVPQMRQILTALKAQKVDLVVLLYQGPIAEAKACAAFCATCRQQDPTLPAVDVVLCLSGDDDEPPSVPDRVGRTLVVRLGHKARYVGVVGAFRTGQAATPYEFRYQLVPISEDYEAKDNPVTALMEEYSKDVKRGNYLAKYPRSLHPIQEPGAFPAAKYVGSARCARCHKEEAKVWTNSRHFHAYKSLEDARRPSLRQYDGECVRCHVIGFPYKTGFTDETSTAFLENVGCESCHGPGSEHIKDTGNRKLRALMNPWKAPLQEARELRRRRELQIDKFCQSCHDIDNDVHWDFNKNWPKIVHHRADRGQAEEAAPVVPEARAVQPAPFQQAGTPVFPGRNE